jgi:hypothetical protein
MKNVSLDRAAVLQLYAHGTDGALNAAADRDILGNHAAIDRCAIADQEIGSAQLAFNSAEDMSWTIAFDVADGVLRNNTPLDLSAPKRVLSSLAAFRESRSPVSRSDLSDRLPAYRYDCIPSDRQQP